MDIVKDLNNEHDLKKKNCTYEYELHKLMEDNATLQERVDECMKTVKERE